MIRDLEVWVRKLVLLVVSEFMRVDMFGYGLGMGTWFKWISESYMFEFLLELWLKWFGFFIGVFKMM